MSNLYFTREHEWVRVENGVGTVGISDFAQGQLGDVVFVELPDVGRALKLGDGAAVVESVKAASDIYAPVGGEVIEVNEALADDPSIINSDPQGAGWFFKIKLSEPDEATRLMTEESYRAYLEEHA